MPSRQRHAAGSVSSCCGHLDDSAGDDDWSPRSTAVPLWPRAISRPLLPACSACCRYVAQLAQPSPWSSHPLTERRAPTARPPLLLLLCCCSFSPQNEHSHDKRIIVCVEKLPDLAWLLLTIFSWGATAATDHCWDIWIRFWWLGISKAS